MDTETFRAFCTLQAFVLMADWGCPALLSMRAGEAPDSKPHIKRVSEGKYQMVWSTLDWLVQRLACRMTLQMRHFPCRWAWDTMSDGYGHKKWHNLACLLRLLKTSLGAHKSRWHASAPNLGRHREGRREGVELLKDLHRLLKKPPPLLKKSPPPLLKKRPTSFSPY